MKVTVNPNSQARFLQYFIMTSQKVIGASIHNASGSYDGA